MLAPSPDGPMLHCAAMRALAAAILLAACGPQDAPTPLTLAWRFADGRRCEAAGALQVQVTPRDKLDLTCVPTTCNFVCPDGEGPGVGLSLPRPSLTLDLTATSPQGNALYRGTIHTDGAPGLPQSALATLYFTGGK